MSRSPERSLARLTVPVGALLAAGLALLPFPNTVLWDALNRAMPDSTPSRVVVVAIDEASLRDYGRLSAWPRGLYTQAIETLEEAGTQAIGVDILLDAPSDTDTQLHSALRSPRVVLAAPPGEPLPALRPGQRASWGISALNITPGGVVRSYQRAYAVQVDVPPVPSGLQHPSLAYQLARLAGAKLPLTTTRHLLRLPAPAVAAPVLSFRDVVNGNVRYADLQGRVAIIGLTAVGAPILSDAARQAMPGVFLQARAVSSMLRPPFTTVPPWLTVLAGMLITALTVLLRGLWGYGLAFALLGLSVLLWPASVLLPGVTLSLCAMLGSALVVLERTWNLRTIGMRDPLTGYGNRLAFNHALDRRWRTRPGRPAGLIMVDLSGFRQVNEQYGRAAGDAVLQDLARRVARYRRRGDLSFRWGADEFALLMDNVSPQEIDRVVAALQAEVNHLPHQDLTLRGNVGGAAYGPDITTPQELVEAASRQRYRHKYARGLGSTTDG